MLYFTSIFAYTIRKNIREMFDMDKIKHFNAITEEEHKEIEDIHKFSIIKLDRKSVLY